MKKFKQKAAIFWHYSCLVGNLLYLPLLGLALLGILVFMIVGTQQP